MNSYKAWVLAEDPKMGQMETITIIPEHLYVELNKWRQYKLEQTEACGVIIGERRGEHFMVTGITPPMTTDLRSRFSCKRNISGHQDILDRLHLQSNGKIQYLGEWHSHPEKNAFPSSIDRKEWKNNYNYLSQTQTIDKMLCLILGIEQDWLGVYQKNCLSQTYLVQS